jgi:protein transport protein SEC24
MTNDRGIVPPLITTQFQAIDNGNCNPRFLRSTLYCAPTSNDLLNQCKIPFAIISQPFATIPDNEVQLQLVDHGPGGPIRSRRGRGYINPFVQFTDGGRCYLDKLDGFTNEGTRNDSGECVVQYLFVDVFVQFLQSISVTWTIEGYGLT